MKYTRQFKHGRYQYISTNAKGENRVLFSCRYGDVFEDRVRQYHAEEDSRQYLIDNFRMFLSNPSHENCQEMIDAMASYQMSKGIRDV